MPLEATEKKTVLILDDCPDMRDQLDAVLRAVFPVNILLAVNAQEAMQHAKRSHIDLFLCDIMMPGGVDGIDVLRLLRATPRYKKTPIFVQSGNVRDIGVAMKAGATRFFVKPYETSDVVEACRQALKL